MLNRITVIEYTTIPIIIEIIKAVLLDEIVLKKLKLYNAIIPINIDANKIFENAIIIFLNPNEPIFFRKEFAKRKVVAIADIDVAKANPPTPKYFERKIFSTILVRIPKVAFFTGIVVS